MRWNKPEVGSIRILKVFLLFPLKLRNAAQPSDIFGYFLSSREETRWLETAYIAQRWEAYWYNWCWVEEEEYLKYQKEKETCK